MIPKLLEYTDNSVVQPYKNRFSIDHLFQYRNSRTEYSYYRWVCGKKWELSKRLRQEQRQLDEMDFTGADTLPIEEQEENVKYWRLKFLEYSIEVQVIKAAARKQHIKALAAENKILWLSN